MDKVVSEENSKGERLSDTSINIIKDYSTDNSNDTDWISTEDDLTTASDSQESSIQDKIEEVLEDKGESTDVEAFEERDETSEDEKEVESTEVAAFDNEITTTEVIAIEQEDDDEEDFDAAQVKENAMPAAPEEKEPVETTEIIQISESEHDAAQVEAPTEHVVAEPAEIVKLNKISKASTIKKVEKTGLLEVLNNDKLNRKEEELDISDDEELSEDDEYSKEESSKEESLSILQGKGDEKKLEQSLDENINEILAATEESSLQHSSESQQQRVKAYDINQDISIILDDTSELTV